MLSNNQIILHPTASNQHQIAIEPVQSSDKPFIQANTEPVELVELRHSHIIPVYVKDNEPLIGHYDFIEAAWDAASTVFGNGNLAQPTIRVSHPIKGRIPEARNKPASELLEREKTLYYERMMFLIEIPCNYDEIGGNRLNLTIGGVKAYNLDNVYGKKGASEHFKVFVGFKNTVCCNLCVNTDGLLADIRVNTKRELYSQIYDLLCRYNALNYLTQMQQLTQLSLSERQFAQLVGRCRLYQHLPPATKKGIPELHFGDSQINQVCRDYYRDESFSREEGGSINLWRVFNLFTGANKSSYIDSFLARASGASQLVGHIAESLSGKTSSWYLS
ncbi:MAG: DUF3871 family protein [Sphingobacteriales bacterium]|nr:MAG: DUF3871 family protein [Sphingobacteriales bacterium]